MKKESDKMKELLAKDTQVPHLPQTGDLIEGRIIKISNTALILELGPVGTGIIYGDELRENKEIIKELKIGQTISALVIMQENEDGYVELSLKKANTEKTWSDLEVKKQTNKTITVKITEANRGGLVIKLSNIVGFLPVSQLSTQNYPRVENGDKAQILQHLNQFIGKEMKVKIIDADKKNDKLIVSEKALQKKKLQENLKNYKKGDIIEGTVTTLANFGAFVKLDSQLEGLIHISELDWQIIDHPSQILKENEKVKAQIIDIQNNQISLSLKALKKDPWKNIAEKYKNGQIVKGKVIKLSSLGAFVQVDKKIYGLAHASEFFRQNQQMEYVLKKDQSYKFEILSLLPTAHKMSLRLKE